MDSSENRPSDGQRRPSSRRSPSISDETHGSRTEESYDLTEFTVADGFRPIDSSSQSSLPSARPLSRPPPQDPSVSPHRSQSPSPSHQSASSSSSSPPQVARSSSDRPAPTHNTASAMRSRPSSISKSHRPHESLTLRNDGSSAGMAHQSGRLEQPAGIPSENDSGALPGPTHPYQAYMQRTTGDTTTPSDDQERPSAYYSGPRRPTHPYSLYPQSTAPLGDPGAGPIPVGFSGLGGAYRRQLGPDGEEAGDLIGPLGHMEELPPYTRYPEQAFVRDPSAQAEEPVARPAPAPSNPSPAAETEPRALPPASGPTATPSMSQQATAPDGEQLAAPRSAHSGDTAGSSGTDLTTSVKDFADRPRGKWARRARTKFLGIIPCWAICLLVFALVIVGIVMGVVLGILLADQSNKKPDGDESEVNMNPSPTVDVEPLKVLPTGLQPLATGLFDLQPLDVSASPRTCFKEPTQSQSWNCEMPLRYYSIEVNKDPTAANVSNYEVQLEIVNTSNRSLLWGTQPPSISDPMTMTLVNDTFELGRGPAWWLQMSFDKTVLVSESNFSEKRKRSWTYSGLSGWGNTRFVSSDPGPDPGDEAWVCTWPNVTMEVFIYPSQNSSLGRSTITTSAPSSTYTETTVGVKNGGYIYDMTPAYPQVVKVLERRLYVDHDEVAATCRKVQVSDTGKSTAPVFDDNGDYIDVVVTERRSTYKELLAQQERSRHPSRRHTGGSIERRETLELTDCACLWWSQ